MAYSTQRAVSDGSLVYLDLSIGYQSRNDIKVFINDLPAPAGRWAWVGITDKRISFSPVIPAGQEVLVQRTTRLDRIINVFARGAKFNNSTMDMNFEQALFLAQEAIEGSALSDIYNDVDFHGYRLKNVAPAVGDGDLVPLGQLKTMSTGAYQARADALYAAGVSEAKANESADSAERSRVSAVAAGQFAQQSQVSAVNADASRANAAQSRDTALGAATRAESAAAPATAIYTRLNAVETVANDAKTASASASGAVASRVSHGNSSLDITWVNNDGLRVRVDQTNFGSRWPISISGRADVATYADSTANATNAGYSANAGYATNAGNAGTAGRANVANSADALSGVSIAGLVRNDSPGNRLSWAWDGFAVVARVDGSVQYAWTEWARVLNRPTHVSTFVNDMRYVVGQGQFGQVAVAAPDGTQFAGFALPVDANRIGRIGVIQGGLYVTADGNNFSWPINPSDARLKKDIETTVEDSLAKIRRMEFKSFTYNEVAPMFAGLKRKAGLIAQDLEQIEPEFVTYEADFRQLNTDSLLLAALHAIQQLAAEVERLKKE